MKVTFRFSREFGEHLKTPVLQNCCTKAVVQKHKADQYNLPYLAFVGFLHIVNSKCLLRRLKQIYAGRRVKLIRLIIIPQLLSNLKLLLGAYDLELSHSLFSKRLIAGISEGWTMHNKTFQVRKYPELLFPDDHVCS